LTAKVRNDLVRVLGKSNLDHMLILASDFDTLEFVFLDKRKRQQKGPGGAERIQVVPKTISVSRRERAERWTCRPGGPRSGRLHAGLGVLRVDFGWSRLVRQQVILHAIAFRRPADAGGDQVAFYFPEDQNIGANRAFEHLDDRARIEQCDEWLTCAWP